MSASSSGKRKISDEGAVASLRPAPALREDASASPEPRDDEHPNHHLPAPIWAHALDYLPYEEVRSALLLCKMIANEASKYVLALNFTKSCQLDGPSARKRFPNVEEVNVLCLYTPYDPNDTDSDDNTWRLPHRGIPGTDLVFHKDTINRIAPCLTGFKKLRTIDFRPWNHDGPMKKENLNYQLQPKLSKFLFDNILGALKASMLPSPMEWIGGLEKSMGVVRHHTKCYKRNVECSFCRDICSYFPLRNIVEDRTGNVGYDPEMPVCLADSESHIILFQRPGGKDVFRDLLISGEKLHHFFKKELRSYHLLTKTTAGKALKGQLDKAGVINAVDEFRCPVRYMGQRSLDSLDGLLGLGFNPKYLKRETLYGLLSVGKFIGRRGRRLPTRVVANSTFDALISRGFPLERKDFIIFDEREAPALLRCITQ